MRKRKNYAAGYKTAVKKTAKKRETNKEDPFLRLPEELLLSILDKLHDLKYLCQCSVVSKHFALVISRIQTVSFTVPSSGALSNVCYQNLHTLLDKVRSPSSEQDPAILEFLYRQNLNLPTFLEKLQDVKSIHLEYLHPNNGYDSSFSSPKWKVEFNDSGKIERYAFLQPISVRKETEDDPNEESLEFPTQLLGTQIINGFWLPCLRFVEWMCLAYMLVKNHFSLKSMTINDSEKQSKLVMTERDLFKLRSDVVTEILKQPWYSGNIVKMVRVPVLHLPLSGYVMRWPVLLLVTPDESCSKDENMREREMIFSGFEDNEKVLAEALKEILKKHGHEIHTYPKVFPPGNRT